MRTKRTHRGCDWGQLPPATPGNLSFHCSSVAEPSLAREQTLCLCPQVFPGDTHICLFSPASSVWLFERFIILMSEGNRSPHKWRGQGLWESGHP